MELIERLKMFEYHEPGPYAHQLMGDRSARMFKLSGLETTIDNKCAWCNLAPTESKSGKYCGRDRKDSATLFCIPHDQGSKMYILVKLQNCICPICEFSWKNYIEAMIRDRLDQIELQQKKVPHNYQWYDGRIDLWQLGGNMGQRWDLDRKVPVAKGGKGFGLDNAQIVCKTCFARKTRLERIAGL